MSSIREIVKDHITYKQQIFKLAKADLVKTYRGSALGWAWAVIKPAVTIFVYWFAFTIGLRAGKDVNGFPFFLWLISGMMPWFYISDMLTHGTDSIRKYSYLVTKMKFPISTIPTFVSISKLIVHVILLGVTVIIFIAMGYPPNIYLIQLPFYVLLNVGFFIAFSLFASLLSSMSKDVSNLIKSFITALFWLSGVLWNVNGLKVEWIKKLLLLNPVTYLIEGYRNCFINKTWFWQEPEKLVCFLAVFLLIFILAVWTYKKLRKEIPDVLN